MRNQKQQFVRLQSLGFFEALLIYIRWSTTVTAKPKTSRQKQNTSLQNRKPHGKKQNTSRQNRKPHSKNKIPHDKTKILTAKPKTSRQNQILHSKSQIPHAKANTHGKLKSKLFCFCCDVFGFAVRFLVLPWGILFLPWGFWFCRDVFVFAVRFLVLPWCFWFCRDAFVFAVRFLVLPWQWLVIIKICTERMIFSRGALLSPRSFWDVAKPVRENVWEPLKLGLISGY